jgi:hypothetical protein
MELLATIDDLKARIEWELSADEERLALSVLEELSDKARFYGRDWHDSQDAPRLVVSTVISAARRYLRNPDGYEQSRAGDEILVWARARGAMPGSPEFSAAEVAAIQTLAGRGGGIYSSPIVAWGRKPATPEGYVPTDFDGEKPFPFFNSDSSDW